VIISYATAIITQTKTSARQKIRYLKKRSKTVGKTPQISPSNCCFNNLTNHTVRWQASEVGHVNL